MNENEDNTPIIVDEDEHSGQPDAHRNRTRIIAAVAVAVIAAVVVLLAVVFTGGGNAAKCEAKLRAMVPSAMAGVDHSDEKPGACKGLSDAELERIGEKVLADVMGGALAGLADAFGEES